MKDHVQKIVFLHYKHDILISIQVTTCQRVKDKIVTAKPELHPVPIHSLWHHIGIDSVGPISPVSKSGNKYVLTVSDYFTKWVCAFALPTKEDNEAKAQNKQNKVYDRKHSNPYKFAVCENFKLVGSISQYNTHSLSVYRLGSWY